LKKDGRAWELKEKGEDKEHDRREQEIKKIQEENIVCKVENVKGLETTQRIDTGTGIKNKARNVELVRNSCEVENISANIQELKMQKYNDLIKLSMCMTCCTKDCRKCLYV